MKKITLFLLSAALLSALGCKKYLDVNKNIDAPDYVDAYLYLANIEQQFQGIYWDIRAIGPLTQMMARAAVPMPILRTIIMFPARMPPVKPGG